MHDYSRPAPAADHFADNSAYRRAFPRHLVHKHAVGEVFVTACRRRPDGEVSIAGELPRAHYYYSDLDGFPVRPEVMPILELCRQACFVLAHRIHDVPLGWQFILRTMSVEISDSSAGIPGTDANGPLRVLLGCSERQRWETAGALAGLEWGFEIGAAHGGPFASATMAMSWMPSEKWAKARAGLRERHGLQPEILFRRPPPASISAEAVGRESQRNVVITDVRDGVETVEADVLVDPSHAGLFDHYNDHIPGMVEAEAARQMAFVAVRRCVHRQARLHVGGLNLTFTQLGELDLPTVCVARVESARLGQHSVTVRVAQAGEDIARGSVLVAEGAVEALASNLDAAPMISIAGRTR